MTAMLTAGCAGEEAGGPSPAGPTIVSLNPCTDAILAEVADPAQLLAISHYSHDPRATSMNLPEARRFAITGGTAEEVLALNPDLVVASTYMPVATRAALERLGIRVELVGAADTVDASYAQIRQIAAAVRQPQRGEALIRRIDTALADTATSRDPLQAVVWQQGGIVPGEGALVSELLRRTGYASHSAAKGLGQADYLPLEAMLADPPEVILSAGDGRAQSHPALAGLALTHRAGFAPSLIYCGGPTIAVAARRLAEIRKGLR